MASKRQYWIGFDLGGTKMLANVFNSKFKVVGTQRRRMKEFRGARAGTIGIVQTIEEAMADAGISKRQLAGIGIGCPGVLNLDKGILLRAPNLGWRNVHLQKILRGKFGCPTVLCNDVDAGTYAEYCFGAAQKARCVVGIFPGTGIGGACVYEGRLLRGRVSSCMEIGHLYMQAAGSECGCGRWGCLETVASRLSIAARAAEAACRGKAPHLLKQSGTNITSIRSRALAKAIAAGDEVVENIVRQAATQLGIAIASVVNLLAPDVVVLGGGLMEALPKPFLAEARRAVREEAMEPFRKARVMAAQLGDNASTLGAAVLVANTLKCRRVK